MVQHGSISGWESLGRLFFSSPVAMLAVDCNVLVCQSFVCVQTCMGALTRRNSSAKGTSLSGLDLSSPGLTCSADRCYHALGYFFLQNKYGPYTKNIGVITNKPSSLISMGIKL